MKSSNDPKPDIDPEALALIDQLRVDASTQERRRITEPFDTLTQILAAETTVVIDQEAYLIALGKLVEAKDALLKAVGYDSTIRVGDRVEVCGLGDDIWADVGAVVSVTDMGMHVDRTEGFLSFMEWMVRKVN